MIQNNGERIHVMYPTKYLNIFMNNKVTKYDSFKNFFSQLKDKQIYAHSTYQNEIEGFKKQRSMTIILKYTMTGFKILTMIKTNTESDIFENEMQTIGIEKNIYIDDYSIPDVSQHLVQSKFKFNVPLQIPQPTYEKLTENMFFQMYLPNESNYRYFDFIDLVVIPENQNVQNILLTNRRIAGWYDITNIFENRFSYDEFTNSIIQDISKLQSKLKLFDPRYESLVIKDIDEIDIELSKRCVLNYFWPDIKNEVSLGE